MSGIHRAVVFDGQEFAGAAHAGLHFVVNEQRAVFAAKLLRLEQIAGGGHVDALALDRFDDERGDVALAQFGFQRGQVVERDHPAIGRNGQSLRGNCRRR
jgi:hypothetical protein